MPISSNMVPLGSRLPWFEVSDLEGVRWTTKSLVEQQSLVVAFMCSHSPYVRTIEQAFGTFAEEALAKGVLVLAISSNDVRAYPSDDVDELRLQAERANWNFPYCLDRLQTAARSFGAACTPEMFLFDRDWRLIYHGQFDASRPGNPIAPSGQDLRAAMDAMLADEVVPQDQDRGFGCSVKWSAGNEPASLGAEFGSS